MKKIIFLSGVFALLTINLWAADKTVLAFSGSTREDSYNQKLILEATAMAKKMGAKVNIVRLKDYPMPFYDADLEEKEGMPENAKRLRELVAQSDVVLIASPEYNRSVSSVLKNTLDWMSRGEYGEHRVFKGKSVAIISASPGKSGGSRGLSHLRTILEDIGATVLPQQASIPRAHTYFSEAERSEHPALKETLEALLSL